MEGVKRFADDLEKKLEPYFGRQAPKMPEGLKNFFADFAYIFLGIYAVVLVLGVFFVLGAVTGARSLLGFMGMGMERFLFVPAVIASLFSLFILYLIYKSFSLVKRKKSEGWRYLFYIALVGLVNELVFFNLIGFIINALINFYILFQIKEKFS